MDYDNDRDRFSHGFDVGLVVDGTVSLDGDKTVVVDDDGVGFDPVVVLNSLHGKKIRITIISLDAMESLQTMVKQS